MILETMLLIWHSIQSFEVWVHEFDVEAGQKHVLFQDKITHSQILKHILSKIDLSKPLKLEAVEEQAMKLSI
jgi:hypothetical protein